MPTKKTMKKTPSKQCSSDQRTPNRSPAPSPQPTQEENIVFSSILSAAAVKFPAFISTDAFRGQIIDFDSKDHGCRIGLSESAMVASSLSAGSLVSVSLAASIGVFSNGSHLDSSGDRLFSHSGMDFEDDMASDVGVYFALAVVLPSSKVEKNGVRLSQSLLSTLGCPSVGMTIFICPIETRVSLCKCTDLYLKLVPLTSEPALCHEQSSTPRDILSETSNDLSGNGHVSSPKTPCNQSKLRSPVSNHLLMRRKNSISGFDPSDGICTDVSAGIFALEDEKFKELYQNYAVRWFHGRYLLHGNRVALPISGETCNFRVEGAISQDTPNKIKYDSVNKVDTAFLVDTKTKVHFSSMPLTTETPDKGGSPGVELSGRDYRDKEAGNVPKLGGLSEEFAALKEIIKFSLINEDMIRLGLQTTKGVLLYGPPGTGKTSLAYTCIQDVGVNLFSVNGPDVVGQYFGESEQALHAVFDSARKASPAVVFIDELDAIAPTRQDGGEALSQRMAATLLDLMDGTNRNDGILVIATTNRPDSIDPALRRPGRFDRELEIGVPSPSQRLDILFTFLSEMDHSLSDADVRSLALTTHGFVGADLAALCNEAALTNLRRYTQYTNSRSFKFKGSPGDMVSSRVKDDGLASSDMIDSVSLSISTLTLASEKESLLKVTIDDFKEAKMKVRPSAMREVMLEVPNVCWEDIGGQKEVKKQLIEMVEWPQKHQDAFERIGTRPPSGVLLFGPPGCSKTLMARAVASKAGLNFLAVKGPELFSKWVGESEKAVRSLFVKARAAAPSVIFFDEIDGVAVIRGHENSGSSVADRVLSQILVELDGFNQRVGVTVIAATNRPDKIDPALLRPGRFDRLLFVGPPTIDDREEIFNIHLRKVPCSSDVSIRELAHLTEGYTGADISLICREAAIVALEENIDITEVSMSHLVAAIGRVPPSDVSSYQDFSTEFQRLVSSDVLTDK